MKKRNFIIQEYINAYGLFKKIKPFLLITIFVFIFTIIIGLVFPQLFENQVLQIIQKMLQELEGKGPIELIIYIFQNNLKASFMGMLLGIFLGIFPLIAGLINGYLIGYVTNTAIHSEGIFVLWKLLPHGLFEFPAIIISLGIGLYLGNRFLERYFKIKSEIHRIAVICFSTLVIIPLAGFYYTWNLQLINIQKIGFSSLSSAQLPLAIAIAIINLTIISGFIFILFTFIKDKILRKDLISSIIFFALIILPLLLIAAIIEGTLIGIMG